MNYRKLKGDSIFDGYRLLEGKVVVLDGEGEVVDLVEEEAAPDALYFPGILTPGFVNCHCHLELSHMKGLIPEKTGLVDFVFAVVTQRHREEGEILEAIAEAEASMRAGGIVAVGDICNNVSTTSQKGKGHLYYHNFIEASGWLPAVSATRFERALQLYATFQQLGGKTSLVPHAPYSVSGELWSYLKPYFAGSVVSIHNQETPFEDQFFRQGGGDFSRMYELMGIDNSHHRPSGKSSVQSYFDHLAPAASALLVHNTFISPEDIDFVQQQSQSYGLATSFCLCINANLYIEEALPPVDQLRQKGCSLVLGTDSLASNWSLSIVDEMAALRRHFPAVPLEEILQWATLNGARALGIDDQFGSFEKGKKPGVLRLQEESLEVERLA